MRPDSVDQTEDSGVLVISAWREARDRPLVLRITSSRGDEPEVSMVSVSTAEVEAVVQRWLRQFEESAGLLS